MSITGREWLALAGFVGAAVAVQIVASALTFPHVREWYPALAKPPWTPPAWVFGPVWTALYLMMAVAAWLVWREAGWSEGKTALTMWFVQLALNGAWSGLFFALRSPLAGLVDIVLLWAAIAATILLFAPVSRVAAGLLLPYLLWVSYAAALNFAIWRLNR